MSDEYILDDVVETFSDEDTLMSDIRNNPVKRLGGMDVHSRINQGDVPSRQIEMDGRGMLPATGHTGRHIADEKGAIGTEFCCYAFELDWR